MAMQVFGWTTLDHYNIILEKEKDGLGKTIIIALCVSAGRRHFPQNSNTFQRPWFINYVQWLNMKELKTNQHV